MQHISQPFPSASRRRVHGLPGDLSRPVFANFNKIDKLNPESFKLWMQVLRRVPGSVLWLLEASAVDTEVWFTTMPLWFAVPWRYTIITTV